MVQVKKDVVTWLKQWFPLKGTETRSLSEIVTALTGSITNLQNGKLDKSSVDSSFNSTSNNPAASNAIATWIHGGNIEASDVVLPHYDNVEDAINNLWESVNALEGVEFVKIVATLPTAAADTMNKLYVVTGSSTSSGGDYGIYVSYKEGNTYKWEQVDDALLKGFITQTAADTRYQAKIPLVTTLPDIGSVNDGDMYLVNNPSESQMSYTLVRAFKPGATTASWMWIVFPSRWDIQTMISPRALKTESLGTTITLKNKGETDEGCIIFNTVG